MSERHLRFPIDQNSIEGQRDAISRGKKGESQGGRFFRGRRGVKVLIVRIQKITFRYPEHRALCDSNCARRNISVSCRHFRGRIFKVWSTKAGLLTLNGGMELREVEWYLPESEAAELLSCNYRKVRGLVEKGVLSYIITPDRKLKISEESVHRFLSRKT